MKFGDYERESRAREALKILEDAWSYFMPVQTPPVAAEQDPDAPQSFTYYDAA